MSILSTKEMRFLQDGEKPEVGQEVTCVHPVGQLKQDDRYQVHKVDTDGNTGDVLISIQARTQISSDSIHLCVYYVIDGTFAPGRFKLWTDEASGALATTNASSACAHNYAIYQGLFETFEYCADCGQKRT